MIPPAVRPDIAPSERAGVAGLGPLLTPEKVATSLRVHRSHDLGRAVEVEFVPEYDTQAAEDAPSEAVAEWLEQRDFVTEESGGSVLEHLVIPAEVLLEEESVVAVRDCHFLVVQFAEPPAETPDIPPAG